MLPVSMMVDRLPRRYVRQMSLVSVPEKTLEHWASQYVTYRYRSKAALWWPTCGEDIDVRWFPQRPGKAVQLELKTTTVPGINFHDVFIDLGQLWQYRQRSLGRQPFYAFPYPHWRGQLSSAATGGRLPVTDLAFARSGPGWWFADWMVVVTAAQVAAVLGGPLTSHGSAMRGNKERLVRFDLTRSASKPVVTWGLGATPPVTVGWRDFWTTLERCGRMEWPQLILLPLDLIGAQRRIGTSKMQGLMREAASIPATGWGPREVVVLEPDGDRGYVVSPTPGDPPHQEQGAEDDTENHSQLTFLDASVLYRKA